MIDDAELAAAIAGRPHWQLDELGAVYAPPGAAGSPGGASLGQIDPEIRVAASTCL